MNEPRGNRLFFDQALRDAQMMYKETPWDVARTLGQLLHHVWTAHPPRLPQPSDCQLCAKAEVYVTVLAGSLRIGEEEG